MAKQTLTFTLKLLCLKFKLKHLVNLFAIKLFTYLQFNSVVLNLDSCNGSKINLVG